jgi:hypothetical protein
MTPISDETVERYQSYMRLMGVDLSYKQAKDGLVFIEPDVTRPVYNILQCWKRDAKKYGDALKDIRHMYRGEKKEYAYIEADRALKGERGGKDDHAF